MDIELIRIALVLAATGVAAWTDYRTGYIYDWITYPLMAAGAILHAGVYWQTGFLDWNAIMVGAVVYTIGFALYYAGKIGGGDVKLFAGLALVLPFYDGHIFVTSVLLFASLLAVTILGASYAIRYANSKPDWNENRPGLARAGGLGILLLGYLILVWHLRIFSAQGILLLVPPLLVSIAFLALEHGIRKKFFLKNVKLSELEEDEIIAREYADEKTQKALQKSALGVLTTNEIRLLEEAGVKTVPIYRSLPPFGPFIFAGVLVVLAAPQLLAWFRP